MEKFNETILVNFIQSVNLQIAKTNTVAVPKFETKVLII